MNTLEDLFLEELKDIYHAEKQLLKALPRMAKAASSANLKTAFTNHLKETEGQVTRLESAFAAMGKKAQGKTCKAMQGLIEEAKELLEEDAEPEVLDAGLIAAAQKVEHYEISGYGTLATWAKRLGKDKVLGLLKQNLAQEKAADEKLSVLAESETNPKADK